MNDRHGRRERLIQAMQDVMGEMPGPERRVPAAMQVLASEELPYFTRQLVSIQTEPADRIEAYLLLPRRLREEGRRGPAMLCLHQTTAVRKEEPAGVAGLENFHYGAELAARGFVCLCPDYALGRNFAAPGLELFDPYAHGYASATMKGIWNHRVCLDLLQQLPGVDGERIGVIGHSLGGHNSLFLAAFDDRVKVTVSSCGFEAWSPEARGDDGPAPLGPWSHSGYMPRIREEFNCDVARMPFDFPELLGSLAPRAVFINAPVNDEFSVGSVRYSVDRALSTYRAQGVEDRLEAVYPDCEHDFPTEARERAYGFVERWLKPGASGG